MDIYKVRNMFEAFSDELTVDQYERFSAILNAVELEIEKRSRNLATNEPRIKAPEELYLEPLLKSLMGLPSTKISVSYAPLYAKLHEFRITFTEICDAAAVPDGQRLMIGYGLPMQMRYLMNIATLLECSAKDLYYELDASDHQRKVLRGREIARQREQFKNVIDDQVVYLTEKELREYRKNNKGRDDGTDAFFEDGIFFPGGVSLELLERRLGIHINIED